MPLCEGKTLTGYSPIDLMEEIDVCDVITIARACVLSGSVTFTVSEGAFGRVWGRYLMLASGSKERLWTKNLCPASSKQTRRVSSILLGKELNFANSWQEWGTEFFLTWALADFAALADPLIALGPLNREPSSASTGILIHGKGRQMNAGGFSH